MKVYEVKKILYLPTYVHTVILLVYRDDRYVVAFSNNNQVVLLDTCSGTSHLVTLVFRVPSFSFATPLRQKLHFLNLVFKALSFNST